MDTRCDEWTQRETEKAERRRANEKGRRAHQHAKWEKVIKWKRASYSIIDQCGKMQKVLSRRALLFSLLRCHSANTTSHSFYRRSIKRTHGTRTEAQSRARKSAEKHVCELLRRVFYSLTLLCVFPSRSLVCARVENQMKVGQILRCLKLTRCVCSHIAVAAFYLCSFHFRAVLAWTQTLLWHGGKKNKRTLCMMKI